MHQLVDLLRPILLRQAFVVLRDEPAGEDVFVEVMSELLGRLPDLRDPDAVIGYARRMARTRAIDTLRRREYRDSRFALRGTSDLGAREPERRTAPIERLAGGTSPELHALRSERILRIRAFIDDLSEPGRTLVHAVFVEGNSLASAAKDLDVSESTARRALRQARALLAARISGYETHPGAEVVA